MLLLLNSNACIRHMVHNHSWPGLYEHLLGEEAGERGVEVGGLAGMGARGLERRAAHRREPAETLVGIKSGYRAATTIVTDGGIPGGDALKRGKLTAQQGAIHVGKQVPQPPLVNMNRHPKPAATLTHHQQPHVDKLLPLHTGHIPYHGILIQVFF